MELAALDGLARGSGPLHRSRPAAKCLMAAGFICAAASAATPAAAGRVAAVILLAALLAGRGVFALWRLALYPLGFAAVYSLVFARGPGEVALLLARVELMVWSTLILIATTPMADVLGVLAPLLPALVADGLYLTYRMFFRLLRGEERLWQAMRLRAGGPSRLLARDPQGFVAAAGVSLLNAIEAGERSHQALELRGYSLGLLRTQTAGGGWLLPVCLSCCAAGEVLLRWLR